MPLAFMPRVEFHITITKAIKMSQNLRHFLYLYTLTKTISYIQLLNVIRNQMSSPVSFYN